MSETNLVTESKHEKLSVKVSRLNSEISELRKRLSKLESYLSPGLFEGEEELPDLDIKKPAYGAYTV